MKKRTVTLFTLFILTLSLLLSSCQGVAEPVETGETKESVTTTAPTKFFDKEILNIASSNTEMTFVIQPAFLYKEYTVEDFAEYGGVELEERSPLNIEGYTLRQFVLRFSEEKSILELEKIRDAMAQREDIYQIGDGYTIDYCELPDDVYTNLQWGLSTISLPNTWDINTGSATVQVGVIDSGIDATHPDL